MDGDLMISNEESVSQESVQLYPTQRSMSDDLKQFDNTIESLIHKYLKDKFVQNDNANARKSFSGLVNSVSQFDFRRNALKDLYHAGQRR